MARPATRTLYILIAVFAVLLVFAFIAGGVLSVILFLAAAAIVAYFVVVAVKEFRGTANR